MILTDVVNGAFEVIGGAAVVQNCRRLVRDQQVRGIDWRVTGFFTSWGVWNTLWYYPSLQQWFSFAGGLVIVLGHLWWLALAIRYRKR